MTNEQRIRIRELRAQGFGYTSIAKAVGLSKDSVKAFCRNHGLAGIKAEYQITAEGRTATYTTTITVLDYAVPSIRQFSAERCNSDGSAAQLDGTKVRYSFQGSVTALNNKNGLSCVVYYKLKSASAWTTAEQMAITSYSLSALNKLLTQTYDALNSYDLKVRLTDYFYYVEQSVSIGTKGVILDFMGS